MGDGDELRRGREAYTARAWADVVDALTAADGQEALQPEDLELLATALFMVGREGDQFAALERAHQGHLDAAAPRRAARCAFWVGMQLIRRGDMGQGGGWIARAQRLVEHEDECAEHGYLLMPEIFRKEAMGDLEGAADVAARAVAIGRRFGDADLFALAAHTQGQLLVSAGRVDAGLRLMDEAMLAVTGGEVSPRPSGIVYCGSIVGCRLAFEPRRAREWTAALHTWCEAQPDMLAFTGDCHVHRAEIMDLHGDWSHALEELDRAAQRSLRAGNPRTAGQAAYRRGEILRRRGDLAAAEEAYRDAGRGGREPQPGLALLRLAQGDTGAALGAIRRVLDETSDPVQRAVLLPAAAEIMVAAGELDAARAAAAELGRIATERPSEMLAATAAHTVGAVELASGDAAAALRSLRRALEGWHDLGAPYEASRVRLLLADACRQVGDNDSAALELESAQESLAALGAAPGAPRDAHGLTRRELEVLRLVAAGATNKAIAAELVLSERTVDRHVSNILAKLRVPSRAAATAYAYEHRLL